MIFSFRYEKRQYKKEVFLYCFFLFFASINYVFGQVPSEIGRPKILSLFSFKHEIKTADKGESEVFVIDPNEYYNLDSFPSFEVSIFIKSNSFKVIPKTKQIEINLKDSILEITFNKAQKIQLLLFPEKDKNSDSLLWKLEAIDVKYLNVDDRFLFGMFDRNHNTVNYEPDDFITLSSVNDNYFITQKNDRVKEVGNGNGTINIGDSLFYKYHINLTNGDVSIKKLEFIPNRIGLKLKSDFSHFDYMDTLNKNIRYYFNSCDYTVLNIWTTYCPPCIKSIKNIDGLEAKYKGKVRFISLLDDENIDLMKKIVSENNIKHRIGLSSKEISSQFLLSCYPSYIVVNKKGQVINYNAMRFRNLIKFLDERCSDFN